MKALTYFLIIAQLIISTTCWAQNTTGTAEDKNHFTNSSPYQTVKVGQVKGSKVKNVILMIGDGMGLVQVNAAWVANNGKLNLDNFHFTGFSRTYCANRLITDSGAAGSAMATGNKVNYHSISYTPDNKPLTSLTDIANKNGLKTGIVVTCNLTDATPAVFCAKNPDRNREDSIATDYLNCNVDYIFGSGRERFDKRADKRNLLDEMKQKGYQVCTSWDETDMVKRGKVFTVIGDGQLPLARERGDLFTRACMHSLSLLNQGDKGFFAMLEGSRIDDCGHDNNLPRLMEEVMDFDRTVGEVLKWAEKDGHTLVIVLADHETGGLTLLGGDIKSGSVYGKFSTGDHSGIMVPVYAYGPGAENFEGMYENTEIFSKIIKLLNIK
jgi:alkaline phosphatase